MATEAGTTMEVADFKEEDALRVASRAVVDLREDLARMEAVTSVETNAEAGLLLTEVAVSQGEEVEEEVASVVASQLITLLSMRTCFNTGIRPASRTRVREHSKSLFANFKERKRSSFRKLSSTRSSKSTTSKLLKALQLPLRTPEGVSDMRKVRLCDPYSKESFSIICLRCAWFSLTPNEEACAKEGA